MPPTLANGKICYVEIPAVDVLQSIAFYEAVFHWQTRQRGDGSSAFDDGARQVSGAWAIRSAATPHRKRQDDLRTIH
jgi:predicted enzyme related to lactoylglutathione lyase